MDGPLLQSSCRNLIVWQKKKKGKLCWHEKKLLRLLGLKQKILGGLRASGCSVGDLWEKSVFCLTGEWQSNICVSMRLDKIRDWKFKEFGYKLSHSQLKSVSCPSLLSTHRMISFNLFPSVFPFWLLPASLSACQVFFLFHWFFLSPFFSLRNIHFVPILIEPAGRRASSTGSYSGSGVIGSGPWRYLGETLGMLTY